MRRDARVALNITDPDNPYRYLDIRGRVVEISEENAEAQIDKLTQKYLGVEHYPYRAAGDVRVTCKIRAERVLANNFPHAKWLSGSTRS